MKFCLFFLLVLTTSSSFANWDFICSNLPRAGVDYTFRSQDKAECEQGGNGQVSQQLACQRWQTEGMRRSQLIEECEANVPFAVACENTGGEWQSSDFSRRWLGRCQRDCPQGTSIGALGYSNAVGCFCDNDPSIYVGYDGNPKACSSDNDLEVCGEIVPGFSSQQEVDEVNRCNARNLEIQLEQQRTLNRARAQELANQAAEDARTALINNAVEQANNNCLSAIAELNSSNCSPLSVDIEQPDFSGGATEASCRALKNSAQRAIEQTASEISRCSEIVSSVSGLCSSGQTRPYPGEATGPPVSDNPNSLAGNVTVPGVQVTAPPLAGEITEHQNFQLAVNSVTEHLEAQGSENDNAMTNLEREADQCIAALEEDDDNSNANEVNDWSGVAQTAADAFNKINNSTAATSGELGSGGGGFSTSQAASTNSFSSSGNRSLSNDGTDFGGAVRFNSGGGPDSKALEENGSENNRRGDTSGNNQLQSGGFGGAPIIGRNFGGSSNSSSGSANQSSRSGRSSYTNSEERNLVLGYKKTEKDGQSVTYPPSALSEEGRAQVLVKLADARKKFGNETPLLYKNGRFMRDYLEMKNRLAWRRHNLRQRNRLSGIFNSAAEQEAKSFHPCAEFGECYSEEKYNIFKLHHFKAIKFLKENQDL